ncbi:MAG: glutamine amidotransferase [Planctomycetota bacterium]
MFEHLFKYPQDLFQKGEAGFATRMPAEMRLLLCAAAAALAFWLYRRSRQPLAPLRRKILIALRAVTLIVLIIMILGPTLRLPNLKNEETFVAVMLDASKSMTIEDAAKGGSRFDAATQLLMGGKTGDGLASELAKNCAVRVFAFADGAKRANDPRALLPDGERTNLFRALRDVDQELRGLPLAAVVLLTDGGNNGAGSPLEMAAHLAAQKIKLYTVGYGSPNPPNDYEIVRVAVPQKVRRNSQVEAFATVRCTGYKDPFTVYLRQGEAILSTMPVRPQPGKDMYQVRFTFYPEQAGQQKYNLYIKPAPDEKIIDNNLREFAVEVSENRLPVLYVEGSPRTEFRFVRRALFRDADFRIVSIVRTGHGRVYVQGADDMPELQKGYPATKDLLYKFEAIIFGDIEAGFFTPEQLRMTEQFVNERGGGFVMLGGVNSFNLGGYNGTPLESLLPVTLESGKRAYSFERFKMQVPEAALRHPILHQDDDPEQNQKVWEHVPELQGYNMMKGVKPAAKVLGVHPQTGQPILAVQPYGRGRAAAFCTGSSWAWRMAVPIEDEIQEKFWRQFVRWLAVGSKESVSVTLDRDLYAKGEPVILRATVLGTALEAVNDAAVKAKIQDPFGNIAELDMPWILTQDGVYQCRYETREHGDHKVAVHVEIPKLKAIDIATAFSVTQPFLEFNNAGLNETLLRQMAEKTGGKYFSESDTNGLTGEIRKLLARQERTGSYVEEKDLWDAPIFFIVLVLCLGLEWSVRRRAGLA